ncbi:MAG: nicotinate phosphoribosyltransferase [Bacillota bacterium]|nr:nicotinate phosphoribosyltransferase [Bacillota bacterium]
MSKYNQQRLSADTLQLDFEGLRRGAYSDAYFSNTVTILKTLASEGYKFEGQSYAEGIDASKVLTGDIEVEMQFFPRRQPFAVVVGVDESLLMLKECVGYYDDQGEFVNTYANLEVEATDDGVLTSYDGNSMNVKPVLKVRGRYRDFAELETPILGVLTEGSRIATNVYNTLVAAKGKDILFFPARFAHYQAQALHGYAYQIAVQAYNNKYGTNSKVFVSTNAQGAYFGAKGGGTISHASIACFLGDTVETMMQFSRIMPLTVPRIALIDFHNDCVSEAKKVLHAMFHLYWDLMNAGPHTEAEKYKLYGVRPDTAGNMRDVSVEPVGDKELDCGVNPRLVWNIRHGLDTAFEDWNLAGQMLDAAKQYCREVKIVVTGGFDITRIAKFESLGVPVDIYGVGSSLLENGRGTTTDFTGDIVRLKINGEWKHLSKLGRKPNENPDLRMVK